MQYPTLETLLWHRVETERVESLLRAIRNEDRRERRKALYRDDPIWRLTKLKDNRERRLRAKRA